MRLLCPETEEQLVLSAWPLLLASLLSCQNVAEWMMGGGAAVAILGPHQERDPVEAKGGAELRHHWPTGVVAPENFISPEAHEAGGPEA